MNRRLLTAIFPLALALLLLAVFLISRWPLWEQNLMSDHSPAAWLSSAQLLGASFLACRLGLDRTFNPLLSTWLAVAMATLAIDEQFMLHEQWKYGCADWFAICSHGWVRELPMQAVALLGTLTLFHLAQRVPDRDFRHVLFASLGVGLFTLCLDLANGPAILLPFEEAFEVSAEALFIGALLIAAPSQGTGSQEHSP